MRATETADRISSKFVTHVGRAMSVTVGVSCAKPQYKLIETGTLTPAQQRARRAALLKIECTAEYRVDWSAVPTQRPVYHAVW
ncbi:MAG: hypothetical protein A2542_03065 [Parcubacteria group bacterium RIFOXYD2_FULL_52_8]|nr:MAG: hypothetical protein A2542_03065 [Parcubacteria group bacterium RIFOXYD2_FULL_52_8]